MTYEVIKGKIAENGNRENIPLEQDIDLQNGISYDIGYAPITSAKKSLGGLPANRDTLNEFFYLTSSNLYAFQNGEFPTFNSDVLDYLTDGGYPLDAILWCEAEGRFVKSATSANSDNFITTPSYIGSSWIFLNDDEVSNITTGLTLTNTSTGITVSAGFVKSSTSGRILKLTSNLNNLWSDIQSNSSLTPSANSKYNLYLAYNPATAIYIILASSYSSFVPSMPSGYTDYALLGYMSTDNDIAVNNVYPTQDLNEWYLNGGANKDKLTRFCVNRGWTDLDGNPDLLSVSGSTITFKVDDGTTYRPLVCTPANELSSFTLTNLNNYSAANLADGNYTLCVSKLGVIRALGSISANVHFPAIPTTNEIFVWTAVEPLTAFYYSGSSWVALNEVPIATITVSSGSITASSTLPYNKDYYLAKELNNMLGRMDYNNSVDIQFKRTGITSYTFDKNGYIRGVSASNLGTSTIWAVKVNNKDVLNLNPSFTLEDQCVYIPVSKGDVLTTSLNFSGTFAGVVNFIFYPQKQ